MKSRYRYKNVNGVIRREHQIVAERTLGRSLKRGEVVHHKDHDRSNNRPSNLVVMSRVEHSRMHGKEGWEKVKKKINAFTYDHRQLVRLYKAGLSLREVARKVGCSHRTVQEALRRHRAKSRSNSEGVKLIKRNAKI